MLNVISQLSIGVLFLNEPIACMDVAHLACGRAAVASTPSTGPRTRGTAVHASDAARKAEGAALAAIQIGVTVLLVAGIASLFAPLAV